MKDVTEQVKYDDWYNIDEGPDVVIERCVCGYEPGFMLGDLASANFPEKTWQCPKCNRRFVYEIQVHIFELDNE